jgi:hypothetical protein
MKGGVVIVKKVYSPCCREGPFSEAHSSKRPAELGSKTSSAAWRCLLGVRTPRPSSVCCSVV